jgi:D-alanine transaminase
MYTAFLNGEFLPLGEARVSPLDRGFLFGDGIYELVPSYDRRMVGFRPHIARMNDGLAAIGIDLGWSGDQWFELCDAIAEQNGGGTLGIYLQVTRGADSKRFHAYPEGVSPTVFAMPVAIGEPPLADRNSVKPFRLSSARDLRWGRCHIKSVSLLGNVMHFQQGYALGHDEVLLYNANDELTECGACNAYVVTDGVVATPPLDHQILPGITRHIALSLLRRDGTVPVEERVVTMDEVRGADEIWVSSSSKEIVPVVELDGRPVGDGRPGEVWEHAQALYSAGKYDF